MEAMSLPRFFRRRYLTLGFLAVLVPLVVLLVMQYVWLTRLERASVIAHQAALRGYLDAVGWEIQQYYREAARILVPPAGATVEGFRGRLEKSWSKHPVDAASLRFVMDFSRATYGNVLFFDEEEKHLISPPSSDDALAIIVTCSPWQVDVYRGAESQDRGLIVDERDSKRRMLLRPFYDDRGHVVAIVGMILDQEWFRTQLLPEFAARELELRFPEFVRDRLTLTARDGAGNVFLGPGGETAAAATWSAHTSLPFLFTDWTLTLETQGLDAERWARTGFLYNMTLSLLLAGVLLGGVFLALRAANRAVRLSEMKSDFVSNVSHELRTPLASIRTFGELLKLGRATPEKVTEYGEHIESESRRLSRLIDNILDFSKIESGAKTYRFAPGRLEEVVQTTVETFRVRTRQRGYRISLDLPPSPLPDVEMDADALGQVFYNLLDNAVKYSGDARRIDVRVSAGETHVQCTIVDHGVGIAPDEQRKVFERFHRVGTGLVHDVKGSGLGLSIVQHVVAAHGGHVDMDSEPGRGTAVTVHLPRTPSEA